MAKFERDGVVFAYDDTGRGGRTPLVFLHGLSSARSTWAGFVKAFATEHRVLTLDHRGHGESAHAPGTYTLDHYGPDAAEFCERVVGEPAVLIGHSLGGVIAHTVAWSRPDLVRGVLLEDPPLFVGKRGPGDDSFTTIFTLMRQVISDLQSRHAPLEEYETLMASAPNRTGNGTMADLFGEEGTRAQARAMARLDPQIYTAAIDGTGLAGAAPEARLSCPIRLLRADPALGPAFTAEDEVRFREANPHAVVTEVQGASHLIHDEQPERVLSEVRALLEALRPLDGPVQPSRSMPSG
jgi:pimeloyl-ACP methyl ester carboxylesterase